MLDDTLFSHEFEILCRRFSRKPHPDVGRRYYDAIKRDLDDKRFRQACKVVFIEDDRFPKPGRIIEAAPPPETYALATTEPKSVYDPIIIRCRPDDPWYLLRCQKERLFREAGYDDDWGKGRYWIRDSRGFKCDPSFPLNENGWGRPLPQIEVVEAA